jgi:hypothetical protein
MAEILTVKESYIDGFTKGLIVGVFQESCNLINTKDCPHRNCGDCVDALADHTELAIRLERRENTGVVISTSNGASELTTNILLRGNERMFFNHKSGEIRLGIR